MTTKSNDGKMTLILSFEQTGDSTTNRSNDLSKNTQNDIVLTPPCQDIEKESIRIKRCCEMLAKTHRNTNFKQVMTLMKYSLDVSKPWVSQYHTKTLDSYVSRHLSKAWFAYNKDSIMKLFSNEQNMSFLKTFGYDQNINC